MRFQHTLVTDATFREEVLESRCPVLVEFRAEWSGASHIMDPVIDKISLYCGRRCKVCLIDYDVSRVVARKYGITTLPTILLFTEGHVSARISGPVSARALEERMDALLGAKDVLEGPSRWPEVSPTDPDRQTENDRGE